MTTPQVPVVHGNPADAPQMPAIGPGPDLTDYYAGPVYPIEVMGDPDPGGRDNVAGTVSESMTTAHARLSELQSDTYGTGSILGDLMDFPPANLDPGAGVGNTMPTAGFYDPPREYGGEQGAPGYQGEAQ